MLTRYYKQRAAGIDDVGPGALLRGGRGRPWVLERLSRDGRCQPGCRIGPTLGYTATHMHASKILQRSSQRAETRRRLGSCAAAGCRRLHRVTGQRMHAYGNFHSLSLPEVLLANEGMPRTRAAAPSGAGGSSSRDGPRGPPAVVGRDTTTRRRRRESKTALSGRSRGPRHCVRVVACHVPWRGISGLVVLVVWHECLDGL